MLRLASPAVVIIAAAFVGSAVADPRGDPPAATKPQASAFAEAKLEFLQRLREWVIASPNDPTARKQLLSLLEDRHFPDDRAFAVQLVGQLPADARSRGAIRDDYFDTFHLPLVHALDDDNYFVRRAAVTALGNWGAHATDAVPKITGFLKLTDKDISLAAARSLASIGPHAKSAVPALIEAISHSGPNQPDAGPIKAEAAKALAKIGAAAKAAVPALADLAKAHPSDETLAAAEALAMIDPGNDDAVAAIRRAFEMNDPVIRGRAVAALIVLAKSHPVAKDRAVALLRRAANDPDQSVRERARRALVDVGADARERLEG